MANEKNNNGLGNQDAENEEEMTVTLTLDDGTELECVVLTIFEAGDREYIALLPLDGREAEDGEVYLYRYVEDVNGTPDLENIESDEEYEIVADAFATQTTPVLDRFLVLSSHMLLLLSFHPMQNQAPSVHDKHIPPGDYFCICNHHISKEWLQNIRHRDPYCQRGNSDKTCKLYFTDSLNISADSSRNPK